MCVCCVQCKSKLDSLTLNTDYPLSPTGSLLRGFRPSLHWLFQHIRGSGERDYVTKEDLRVILRGEVDSNDLDEAFDRLDSDGNGQITEDEFMNGFATFLVEASTAQNEVDDFDTTIGGHTFRGTPQLDAVGVSQSRSYCMRHRRERLTNHQNTSRTHLNTSHSITGKLV